MKKEEQEKRGDGQEDLPSNSSIPLVRAGSTPDPSLSPFVHSALPGTTAVEPREQPEIGLGIGLQEFGGIPREDADAD
jgi:hypothetical protein